LALIRNDEVTGEGEPCRGKGRINAEARSYSGKRRAVNPNLSNTGLNGTFDFILEFDPESLGREDVSNVPHEDSGPTFSAAMKDQLGLQVKKQEGSVSIFVVDNVEYPSAN
jgi:uncharacterized protein (TIGR03435 family)